jgi:hypothetical protein
MAPHETPSTIKLYADEVKQMREQLATKLDAVSEDLKNIAVSQGIMATKLDQGNRRFEQIDGELKCQDVRLAEVEKLRMRVNGGVAVVAVIVAAVGWLITVIAEVAG